jgi:hypothetical protein
MQQEVFDLECSHINCDVGNLENEKSVVSPGYHLARCSAHLAESSNHDEGLETAVSRETSSRF